MTKMEKGEVVMSGYLIKSPPATKIRNLRSWTKRYFVLYANKLLYYYKNERDKRPVKEPIMLANCKCVDAKLNHERFEFVFSIVTPQRIYYLVARTQGEMEEWVDKLIGVCGFRRTDQHSHDVNSTATQDEHVPVAQPQPTTASRLVKHHPVNPSGTTPSSFSSSGSSLTSPTGPCPLSIPKHLMDVQNKQRSTSDPPDPFSTEAPQNHRERMRKQSEQIGSAMFPGGNQMTQSKARLSGNLTENYDDVPSPRPYNSVFNLSSPKSNSGNHLFSKDYDAVPDPRPVSQGSDRSSQDVYDLVPAPRPLSSSSQDGQSLYDVPLKVLDAEDFDIAPPVHRAIAPKPSNGPSPNYDVLPPSHSALKVRESVYDVLPPGRVVEEENYDVVPHNQRPVAPIQTGPSNENYDVVPKRNQFICEENYDIVPPTRPVAPKPNCLQQKDPQELYDILPRRDSLHRLYDPQNAYDTPQARNESTKENYDIVPPVCREPSSKPSNSPASQENYDVVPIPRPSHETYDIVPSPRARDTYDLVPSLRAKEGASCNGHEQCFSDTYAVPPNLQSPSDNEWVPKRPAPYRPAKDPYDPLPNTNRPVSADSGLNASFTSICSLKSDCDDGPQDKYNPPLPALPNSRDSGSLSDDSPDDAELKEVYDRPPSWEEGDSIYDVPPKREDIYDVLPRHSDDIHNTPPSTSNDIYDVPPSYRNAGFESESHTVPEVDRSTKRPPQVNRATKPKTTTSRDHSYCNMAPPVDRKSKNKRRSLPPTEPSYVNYGGPPPRPQNLPLVKTLSGNSFGGRFSNQMRECPIEFPGELDYTPMEAPTRSEMTRCYSYSKEECSRAQDNDQFYEDMSALQIKRHSGERSNSSSSSSLADNEDVYTSMAPVDQRQRRNLLYAEVEIVEGMQQVRMPVNAQPRRENTNYTFINEESTRALIQTSHARQGHR